MRDFNKVKVVSTTQNLNEAQKRKYVKVMMNKVEVKLQLNAVIGITIINEKPWKNISEPTLTKNQKIASGVSGRKLYFPEEIAYNVLCADKILKTKSFVLKKIIR